MLYSDLTANIQSYVENSFTATQLATFVQQAEQRIFNAVQLPELRKNVTGQLTSGSPYLSVPSDFLSAFSLALTNDGTGVYKYLLNKDVNFIREAYPNPSVQAAPRYYAIFGPQSSNPLGLSLMLGPTPDAAYYVELHYFHYPQSIVTAGETWLGDNFDSALLWGSIVEAYHFLKGEQDLIAAYQKRYDDAFALLKQLGDGKNRMDNYRSGQVRAGVR